MSRFAPHTCKGATIGRPWPEAKAAGECSRCWSDLNRARKSVEAAPAPQPAHANPCRHLGEPTGEKRDCPTCGGNVRQKVYRCNEPSERHPLIVLRDCETCPDRG